MYTHIHRHKHKHTDTHPYTDTTYSRCYELSGGTMALGFQDVHKVMWNLKLGHYRRGGRREGTKERKVTPQHTSKATAITSTKGEGDCVS